MGVTVTCSLPQESSNCPVESTLSLVSAPSGSVALTTQSVQRPSRVTVSTAEARTVNCAVPPGGAVSPDNVTPVSASPGTVTSAVSVLPPYAAVTVTPSPGPSASTAAAVWSTETTPGFALVTSASPVTVSSPSPNTAVTLYGAVSPSWRVTPPDWPSISNSTACSPDSTVTPTLSVRPPSDAPSVTVPPAAPVTSAAVSSISTVAGSPMVTSTATSSVTSSVVPSPNTTVAVYGTVSVSPITTDSGLPSTAKVRSVGGATSTESTPLSPTTWLSVPASSTNAWTL